MQKAVWNGLGEGTSADPIILEVNNDFDINNSFNIKIENNFMGWQNEENYFKFSNSSTVYLLALVIKDENNLKYFMTKNAIEYTFIVSDHMNINEGPFTVTSYLGAYYLLKQQIFSIQDMALEEVREIIRDLVDKIILFDFLDVKVTELLLTDESETRIAFDTIVNAKDADTLREAKEYTDDKLSVEMTSEKVKQLYESSPDTNVFDDATKDKLENIENGAQVNVKSDWDATTGDAEILNKPAIPTKASDLTNDAGYITEYTETDPIFTAWNKSTGISITRSQVSDLIEATQALSGLMSASDKQRLDALHALLEEDTENNVVDSINEILAIFQNYPEGADLVTALAGKVDKVAGKGLSTEDYTTAEKNKLNGIQAGAQVNPSAAQVKTLYEGNADTNAFTNILKGKLEGIEAGAEVNKVNSINGKQGVVVLNQDDIGDGTTYKQVSQAEKNTWDNKQDKLIAGVNISIVGNTISASGSGEGTQDITAEQVKTLYEANADTNAFTDGEKSKLSGIETGAQVNTVTSVAGKTGAVELVAVDIPFNGSGTNYLTDETEVEGAVKELDKVIKDIDYISVHNQDTSEVQKLRLYVVGGQIGYEIEGE